MVMKRKRCGVEFMHDHMEPWPCVLRKGHTGPHNSNIDGTDHTWTEPECGLDGHHCGMDGGEATTDLVYPTM